MSLVDGLLQPSKHVATGIGVVGAGDQPAAILATRARGACRWRVLRGHEPEPFAVSAICGVVAHGPSPTLPERRVRKPGSRTRWREPHVFRFAARVGGPRTPALASRWPGRS